MTDEHALLRLQLPSRFEAPSAARKALAALNGDLHLVSEARLWDAQLLTSELITNSVRHAGGDVVDVLVYASPETLRVEVIDGGAGFDPARVRPPATGHAGSWGLSIVDAIAHRWGTDHVAGRVRVWFEVDRPQSDAPLKITGEASPPA
jgi:anti-sigma regulatory factor (Ser/Thr protein kinase)